MTAPDGSPTPAPHADPVAEPVGVPEARGSSWTVRLVVALVAIGAGAALFGFVVGRDDRVGFGGSPGSGGPGRVAATSAVVGETRADAAAAYLELTNDGSEDDRLVRVTSSVSPDVSLHVMSTRNGLSIMEPADGLDLPAGRAVRLDPGGSHVMLGGLGAPLTAGSTVPLRLEFDHSPAVDVRALVLPLEQLAERVGR